MLWLSLHSLVALATAALPKRHSPPLCGTPFAITPANLDLFDQIVNGSLTPDQGSSDILGNLRGPKAWPRNAENKVVIPYCYQDADSRSRLDYVFVNTGIGAWMWALGGPASRESGHAIVFTETLDQNRRPVFCTLPGTEEWDSRLDPNTVVVYWDEEPGAGASATAGFVGFDTNNMLPGIHQLAIGATGFDSVTHEVGHILGMAHEHQRQDRDAHISYRCSHVYGYQSALDAYLTDVSDADPRLLCDRYIVALQYGFDGAQFVAGQSGGDPRDHAHGVAPWTAVVDHGAPYDFESVMHYPSDGWVNDGVRCEPGHLEECVLVRKLEGGGEGFIPFTMRPSAGDVRWVRETYGWREGPGAAKGAGVAGRNFTA